MKDWPLWRVRSKCPGEPSPMVDGTGKSTVLAPTTGLPLASEGTVMSPHDHRDQVSCHVARVLPKALDFPGVGLFPARTGGGARHRAVTAVRTRGMHSLMILIFIIVL